MFLVVIRLSVWLLSLISLRTFSIISRSWHPFSLNAFTCGRGDSEVRGEVDSRGKSVRISNLKRLRKFGKWFERSRRDYREHTGKRNLLSWRFHPKSRYVTAPNSSRSAFWRRSRGAPRRWPRTSCGLDTVTWSGQTMVRREGEFWISF